MLGCQVTRPISYQPHHDCPRVIASIVADNDPINALVDVLAVAITIHSIEILALKAKIVPCSPNLTLKYETKIEPAKDYHRSGSISYRKFRLVGDIITRATWRFIARSFKIEKQLSCEARFMDSDLSNDCNCFI